MHSIPIVIARHDGSAAVMAFLTMGRGGVLPDGAAWVDEAAGVWARPARESLIADEVKRAVPDYIAWHRVVPDDIPTDRTYRDAWHHDGKTITHDMPKAREIHRNALRHERASAFIDLDGKWQRATGQGKKAEADAIEAQRQRWRDAPADPRIDAAQTVEDLKVIEHG
jgi:hypothetical protein